MNKNTKFTSQTESPEFIKSQSEEIDLIELFSTLRNYWKLILLTSLVATILSFIYAFYSSEVFRAETLLAPAEEEMANSPSYLSQLGGLASVAGISIPSNSNIERVLATLRTREFLKTFIVQRNLLPILFSNLWDESKKDWKLVDGHDEPRPEDGISVMQAALDVESGNSGLITLSVSWNDPIIAANWANELVVQLNEQLRESEIKDSEKRIGYLEQELARTTLQDMRSILYNLLGSEKQKAMLANVNKDFALEVIDPAVVPKIRQYPKRKLIIVMGSVSGLILGILFVFFAKFVTKLKSASGRKSESHE